MGSHSYKVVPAAPPYRSCTRNVALMIAEISVVIHFFHRRILGRRGCHDLISSGWVWDGRWRRWTDNITYPCLTHITNECNTMLRVQVPFTDYHAILYVAAILCSISGWICGVVLLLTAGLQGGRHTGPGIRLSGSTILTPV